jgi:hypothetical protein
MAAPCGRCLGSALGCAAAAPAQEPAPVPQAMAAAPAARAGLLHDVLGSLAEEMGAGGAEEEPAMMLITPTTPSGAGA